MEMPDKFHNLPEQASDFTPPSQMTYPFCYEAHPLCQLAANEVRKEIELYTDWKDALEEGKMLGVLVVETSEPKPCIGFLAAFSGTLCGLSTLPYFVPPVFDLHGTYFQDEERHISNMSLSQERTARSQALQQWLFQQFHMLNARGEVKDIIDIFHPKLPPSGAGECCAPKLLQYAYLHKLRPLCMAEFWVGRSPKGEIREEGHFYPACQHKCKPILGWMLQGLDVEDNPMYADYDSIISQMRIIYSDQDIVVIDKPAGMLSVPGKDGLPSVKDIILEQFPQAEGPIIVHRLDMDTSGLMVLALNTEAYHHLQEQFIHHTISKRYSALLERPMEVGTKGRIDLLICPNPYDRPRQMVNEEYGRRSVTRYEVMSNRDGHALIHLWPDTGRTHQLRLHMAHPLGLSNPIVGDRLYGHTSTRLMLFADRLEFTHPRTQLPMSFELT